METGKSVVFRTQWGNVAIAFTALTPLTQFRLLLLDSPLGRLG
jgi:hypothetical protein